MSEEEIFHEALAKSTPEERAAFLEQACAADPELRASVEALLQASVGASAFLAKPPSILAGQDRNEPGAAAIERREPTIPALGHEGPGTIIGAYKVMEQIGEGGMGLVYVAEQQQPIRRKVALKILKPGMDTRAVIARFEAERQALALMDHPNIAKVYDGGETASGRPFFVMELIKGLPINDYCDENRLTPRARLELFHSVCQAVQHAHQKGIIHRDIKPSNVLVTSHDGTPVIKIIDFGIAKALGQQLTDKTLYTQFTQLIGTPLYMSPEQAGLSSLDVDTRTDIYALGVLLYELLTGTTPFDRERLSKASYEEMRRIIREEEPPKPSTRISTLGKTATTVATVRKSDPKRLRQVCRGELDWIVMKCLEKDRDRRYETANGLALDVERYLRGDAVLAHPPSAGYRLRKFVRRNRGPVLAASLFILALLAGIIGTAAGLIRAQNALQAEAEQRQKALAAAEAEKLANEQAQKRLRQIEKGNEILLSVFTDLDPRAEEKLGKPLRAVLGERLAKAAEQIEGESLGDSLVVARLQDRLAESLLNLGMSDKAISLYVKALASREATLGHNHPDTLNTISNLANVYQAAGKLDMAIPLHEEALRLMKPILGSDHPNTLTSMNNLGFAYHAAGKLDLAVPILEETLQLRKAKLGGDHIMTASSMNSLGRAYQDMGKLDLALPLLQEALRIRRAKLGADHSDTLTSMNNLAICYRVAGKLDQALPLLEETLRLRKLKLGTDHPDTVHSMNNLASGYFARGKVDLATPLLEETLRLMKAKLGVEHPDTLYVMNNLARTYQASGKVDLALPLFRESAAGIEKRRFQHSQAARIVHNLIDCLERLKRFDEAEAWRRKWLVHLQERGAANSPAYADELAALGANLQKQNKPAEADRVLRESRTIREKLGPKAVKDAGGGTPKPEAMDKSP
jgi:serine/threonine protein kinase/tetratricopeptide (TPR) repeat protein